MGGWVKMRLTHVARLRSEEASLSLACGETASSLEE